MSSTSYRENRNTKSEILALHEDLKELTFKVDRILRTLIGDEEMAQKGLVEKVERHDEWIEKQKVVLAKIFGVAIGSGLFGGVITQLLMKLL
jgi:hypothetical protein